MTHEEGPVGHDGNRHLMEAAEDLLRCCKEYMDLFRDSDMRPEDECYELFFKMEAAVAKAKGLESKL